MSFMSLLALAFGLAMDATAVAAGKGYSAAKLRARDFLTVGLLFGGFQAGMPLLGFFLGARIGRLVAAWDHWIAFALLAILGIKMIHESIALRREDAAPAPDDPFALKGLLALAVATSIDAFAVGITLPMLDAPLGPSLLTIGVVTALTSALGLFAGHRFGRVLGPRLDLLGGVILIALGLSILVQHLRAG
jgi:putative Mn2+ efflux pump MntP